MDGIRNRQRQFTMSGTLLGSLGCGFPHAPYCRFPHSVSLDTDPYPKRPMFERDVQGCLKRPQSVGGRSTHSKETVETLLESSRRFHAPESLGQHPARPVTTGVPRFCQMNPYPECPKSPQERSCSTGGSSTTCSSTPSTDSRRRRRSASGAFRKAPKDPRSQMSMSRSSSRLASAPQLFASKGRPQSAPGTSERAPGRIVPEASRLSEELWGSLQWGSLQRRRICDSGSLDRSELPLRRDV